MNIILIAPPAAGKGTQSELLSSRYNIPHISTGRLIRELNDENINKLLSKGQLLEDEFVLDLLEKRLLLNDCHDGFIIDGFPRNLKQASMFEDLLNKLQIPLGIAIYLEIDSDIALKRIIGRLECSNCGSIYNDQIKENNPKEEGICDKCGQQLSRRIDDNKETFLNRYNAYLEKTHPLIEYFEKKNMLYKIDSNVSKEATFNQIEELIRSLNEQNW